MGDNEIQSAIERIFRHQPLSHIQRQCLEPFIAGAIRQAHAAGIERAADMVRDALIVVEMDELPKPSPLRVMIQTRRQLEEKLRAAAKEIA